MNFLEMRSCRVDINISEKKSKNSTVIPKINKINNWILKNKKFKSEKILITIVISASINKKYCNFRIKNYEYKIKF